MGLEVVEHESSQKKNTLSKTTNPPPTTTDAAALLSSTSSDPGGHPNVLHLLEAYEDTRYIYLRLEYCPNAGLQNLLLEFPGSRLPDTINLFVFRQILLGVEFLQIKRGTVTLFPFLVEKK